MAVGNYYRFDNKGAADRCEPRRSLCGVRQPCPVPFSAMYTVAV